MRSLGNHFQNLFFKKVVILDDPKDIHIDWIPIDNTITARVMLLEIIEKFHILKPIERECLIGMCQDISDAEMGRRLGYTYQNISYHKKNAIKKLQEELS
jgi:DNA-directed RNA polymerase specialized sigma subunit